MLFRSRAALSRQQQSDARLTMRQVELSSERVEITVLQVKPDVHPRSKDRLVPGWLRAGIVLCERGRKP